MTNAEKHKEFIEILDSKIEQLTSEKRGLLPVYTEYQVLSNQIRILQNVRKEFQEEGRV